MCHLTGKLITAKEHSNFFGEINHYLVDTYESSYKVNHHYFHFKSFRRSLQLMK